MIFLWRTIRSGRGIVVGMRSTKGNVRTVNVGIIAQRDVAHSKPLRSVKSNSIAMLVLSRYNFRIVRACARPWQCPRRSTLIVIILYQKMMKHPGRRCTQWWHLERVLIFTIWAVILVVYMADPHFYIRDELTNWFVRNFTFVICYVPFSWIIYFSNSGDLHPPMAVPVPLHSNHCKSL